MKGRCLNPKHPSYPDYGGRGIGVCKRWLRFENFLTDMGLPDNLGLGGAYIERIDNDKGYDLGNCRWATVEEQLLNRRNTVKVTLNGITKPLLSWCEEMELDYHVALARLRAGKPIEKILEKHRPRTRFLTHRGITKQMKDWAKDYGIGVAALSFRLRAGWSVKEALETPLRGKNG